MKILVTAFEPFGGQALNPAQQALAALPDNFNQARLEKLLLPTAFHASAEEAIDAIRRIRPDAVLLLGQAGGRVGITVERVAINIDDADIPDNRGAKPTDQPIFKGGPAAFFSTLPINKLVQSINESGAPAFISNTAGTYVCNHLLYQVLHLLRQEQPACRAGFVHLPWLPEQVKEGKAEVFTLPLDKQVKGIQAALHAIIQA